MKHNFIVDAELSIHPVDGFEHFTQNSVGTKYFSALLDGWALAAGEALFIAFETADKSYKIDPVFMLQACGDRTYGTVMPDEVMLAEGEWTACIYKKLNFNENTGKADAQEVGKPFPFTVMRTIRDSSGNAITQYDLMNVAKFQLDLKDGGYAARGLFAWSPDAIYGLDEIVFYPNAGKYGMLMKSKTEDNMQHPFLSGGGFNFHAWEVLFNFDELNGAIITWGFNESEQISNLEWEVA